jgi:choline dehydrogenase-like flavoprotein
MNDPVDVLIIGAGASGAAVAWSLADTKMHILCLEQGGLADPVIDPRRWNAVTVIQHRVEGDAVVLLREVLADPDRPRR